ncbi:MAG: protein kinase, partial [Myxococcales bacterium]|nr:protein kinase [Myxococcales bacterium]
MGRVYRAHDQSSGSAVAIKCLRPEYAQEPRIRRRFMREARAVQRLAHPHIVRMYGYGEDTAGVPYIAMEYIDGKPLSEQREDGLTLETILRLVDQVLSALAYSHARGIIHRDIKPENIVVVEEPGGQVIAKLLDFGFARVEDDPDPKLTAVHGDAFGTPQYMAPEQASGKGKVTAATDLYSLGVILFEFLSGRPPFTGAHGMAVALKHLMEPVPPLRARPGLTLPNGLEAVVLRALRKEPHERFSSAAEMRRALAIFHVGGVAQRTEAGDERSRSAAAQIARVVGAITHSPPPRPEFVEPAVALEHAPSGPVPVFDLEAEASAAQAPQAPLVGREEEQLWLWEQVRHVFERGAGRLLLVGGAAGLGRSRLIGWLRDEVTEGGWMWAIGGVHGPGSADAGGGLRTALEDLFGQLPEERSAAEAALRDVVIRWSSTDVEAPRGPIDEVGISALASYLRPGPFGSTMRSDRAGEVRGEVLFARICDALRLASRTRPLLLTLEGIERAGHDIGDFLVHLATRLRRQPFQILVIASYEVDDQGRPGGSARVAVDALERLAGDPVEHRTLSPLAPEAMRTLLDGLGPLDAQVTEAIIRRTDGNPYFARELVGLLRQAGELTEREGHLTLARGAQPAHWPKTLPATLFQRAKGTLGALEDSDFARWVFESAAVLGEAFDYRLLVDFLSRVHTDRPRIDRAVEGLLQVQFFEETRDPYVDRLQFAHPMLRDILLRVVSRRSSIVALHQTAAQAMVEHYGVDVGRAAAQIADHFEAGGLIDEAAQYATRAAVVAREEGLWQRATELMERADRLWSRSNADDATRRRANLWLDLAEMELRRNGLARARQLAVRVHQWAASQGDSGLIGRAVLVIAELCRLQGNLAEASRA